MKKIIVLLCCGLMGCSTVPKASKLPTPAARIVTASPSNIIAKLPVAKAQTITIATTTVVSSPKTSLPSFTPQVALGLRPVLDQKIPVDQKEVDNIIVILNEAIKNKPNDAGVYYNRAVAYFYKKNYDLSWEDVYKAEALGMKTNPRLVELVDKLKEVSGREK